MNCATSARLLIAPILLASGMLLTPYIDSQPAKSSITSTNKMQGQALVESALAAEVRSAQDTSHPMRYMLRKSSPRLTSTKEICENRDGAVARLRSLFDKPLSTDDEQKEQTRLNSLLSDSNLQRHRKQSEDADTARAMKILRMLPQAFLYQFAGPVNSPSGPVEKFTFHPNPSFKPPDLETQVLTAMSGEIWIDPAQERVVHLQGQLNNDVDFGWGILGRLYKGGWVTIDQARVSGNLWRITHLQMVMTGRVLFKNKSFDTVEDQTYYTPVPSGLDYRQAIQILRSH